MKVCSAILVLILLMLSPAAAQSSAPPKSAGQTPAAGTAARTQAAIDPAKEADIRRLLELTGTRKMMMSTMDSMTTSVRPMLTNALPAGDYRDKLIDLFFEKFRSKADLTQLLDLAVPLYDRHFTHDEIKELIKFYETPIGQKTISVLPQLMNEMHQEGEKWGQKLGRDCMTEVLAEHPDLAQALKAASKNSHP